MQQGKHPAVALPRFPATRYQGSKAKLVAWIWEQIQSLDFTTCLDAFGGTGSVAYMLKQQGKAVTYNDLLRFNHLFGVALIENDTTQISQRKLQWILQSDSTDAPSFIRDTFHDIYFTDEENAWIDRTIARINQVDDQYVWALAFFALCQASIVKRPYNLFHRKNLYMRFAEVKRSFGNKTAWDKPFSHWFQHFVQEANQAVFRGEQRCVSVNCDAELVPGRFDLVYIDPPYISSRGTPVNYLEFYHFLEGLSDYTTWHQKIDWQTKHRRLERIASDWTNKEHIHDAFDRLCANYAESILVVSYRNDGIPTAEELLTMLRKYKDRVSVHSYGQYQYVLSTNARSHELLFIGI